MATTMVLFSIVASSMFSYSVGFMLCIQSFPSLHVAMSKYCPFDHYLFYRNFMIQGGDPTGTGSGGESIWGQPFKDELNSKLLHSGRGVVSMANSGPHTNGSQFFILYKSAAHLNFKHTVFGMVVGGITTLSTMEKVPVDDDDRPLVSMILFVSSAFSYIILRLEILYIFLQTRFCGNKTLAHYLRHTCPLSIYCFVCLPYSCFLTGQKISEHGIPLSTLAYRRKSSY
jgi:cyclophilin family peptidyl-prolyl cis-trans isomerase